MAPPAHQNEKTREKLCPGSPARLPSGFGPPIMTFHEFRKVKEKDRQGHFKNKAPKKRKVDENKDSATAKLKNGHNKGRLNDLSKRYRNFKTS